MPATAIKKMQMSHSPLAKKLMSYLPSWGFQTTIFSLQSMKIGSKHQQSMQMYSASTSQPTKKTKRTNAQTMNGSAQVVIHVIQERKALVAATKAASL